MPNHVEQQIDRVNGIFGELNTVNDSVAGGQPSSLTSAARYAGQLGARLILDASNDGVNNAATGLFGGWYQYVQFLSTATQAPALGRPVFWNDTENYIVDTDSTVVKVGKFAGITINTTANPVSKGNFAWIQVQGKVQVKFVVAITKATPADGDFVIVDATTGLADILADATALTGPTMKAAIGVAWGVPVTNALNKVLLKGYAPFVV